MMVMAVGSTVVSTKYHGVHLTDVISYSVVITKAVNSDWITW